MKKYFTPLTIVIVAAVLSVGGLVYGFAVYKKPTLNASTPVARMDLTEQVAVSGTVSAAENVALSFQRGGQVVSLAGDVGTKVYKGQIIASVSSSDLDSQLEQAEIALQTEQLKLQNLQSPSQTGASSSVQVGISNARTSLLTEFNSGYVSVNSALATNVDPLFNNARTNPQFGVTVNENGTTYSITAPYTQSQQINSERQTVNQQMTALNTLIIKAQTSGNDSDLSAAESAATTVLASIQQLLTDISTALNSYNGQDSQALAIYTGYRNQISAAQTSISAAQLAVQNDINTYTSSQTSISGYDISLQQAAVKAAQAQIDAINTQISEGSIHSPIDGVITEQDIKLGEVAGANTPVIDIDSSGKFQIDSYVSEADINSIKVGDTASVTLTAQGQATSTYTATVVTIDPAETMTNGIGSYKVTLQFNNEDDSIKAGMTANVDFVTASKSNVLAVPESAIITQNNNTYVLVSSGNQVVQRQVVTGIEGSNGYVEIVSGLNDGDAIITFGNQQ